MTPFPTTVAGLALLESGGIGTIATIIDGTGPTDCSVGGGSIGPNTCKYVGGGVWVIVAGSGGGGTLNGGGTANTLAMWTGPLTLGNGPVTYTKSGSESFLTFFGNNTFVLGQGILTGTQTVLYLASGTGIDYDSATGELAILVNSGEPILADNTHPVLFGNGVDTDMAGVNWEIPNAPTGGTVAQETVCLNPSAQAIVCPASTTSGIQGVANFGAGTTGNVTVCYTTGCFVLFDNTAVLDDLAIPSSTPGYMHDIAASTYTGTAQIMRVTFGNSGAGTPARVNVLTPDILSAQATAVGSINPGSNYAFSVYPSTTGTTLSPANIHSDSTGNDRFIPGFDDFTALGSPPASGGAGHFRSFGITTQGFTRLNIVNEAGGQPTVLGRDNQFIVQNGTGAPINAATAVYISGSTSSNIPIVGLAQANNLATAPAVGLVYSTIGPGAYGYVMKIGILTGLNTVALGVSPGQSLFLSCTSAGGMTTTRPVPPCYAQKLATGLSSSVSAGALDVVIQTSLGNHDSGSDLNFDLYAGAYVPSGQELEIKSGGSLVCDPGSTCPTPTLPLSATSGIGDGVNAIAAATYPMLMACNNTGKNWTVTAIHAYVDAGTASTLDMQNNAGTSFLTGVITATGIKTSGGAPGTLGSTVTLANTDCFNAIFVADGSATTTTWTVNFTQ